MILKIYFHIKKNQDIIEMYIEYSQAWNSKTCKLVYSQVAWHLLIELSLWLKIIMFSNHENETAD